MSSRQKQHNELLGFKRSLSLVSSSMLVGRKRFTVVASPGKLTIPCPTGGKLQTDARMPAIRKQQGILALMQHMHAFSAAASTFLS